jgi:Raf kinase inhibitor-like YbhB/YbcL family protein
MALQIQSPAFEENRSIPVVHSGDGADRSPPLAWRGAPERTTAYALIVDDPDAPSGTFVHWVAYNIPAKDSGLPEGIEHRGDMTDGMLQGKNDFGRFGYNGPKPPRGKPHHYHFKLYALSERLELEPGATKADVERAMAGRVLDHTELTALYQRS